MTSQAQDHQFTLHVAGALHVDEVATLHSAYVPRASNPVSWQRSAGGVGSNAARAAQKVLSAIEAGKLCLHAAAGADSDAGQLITVMQAQGFDVAAQKFSGYSTGRYSAVISQSGELVLGLADVQLAEQLQAAPIISMLRHNEADGLLLDANLSLNCLGELVAAAGEMSNRLAAMTVSPGKALKLLPIARKIPLLFCNRREATAMAIESGLVKNSKQSSALTLTQLMHMLVDMGFNDCVLTDGGNPLTFRYQGVNSTLPVPETTIAQNVNGAGDALAGACFAAMLAGYSLPEALERYGISQALSVLSGHSLLTLHR